MFPFKGIKPIHYAFSARKSFWLIFVSHLVAFTLVYFQLVLCAMVGLSHTSLVAACRTRSAWVRVLCYILMQFLLSCLVLEINVTYMKPWIKFKYSFNSSTYALVTRLHRNWSSVCSYFVKLISFRLQIYSCILYVTLSRKFIEVSQPYLQYDNAATIQCK